VSVDEELAAFTLWRGGALLRLFLDLSHFLLVPLLNLLERQVVGVFLDRFLELPQFVSLSLVGDVGAEGGGEGYSLNAVVVVLELLSSNPLLVVEGEHDAHRGLLYQFEGVFVDLCSVEEPGQRGHDALQTLQLPVPCGISFSFIGAVTGVGAVNDELDPFNGGIIESRAHDLQMFKIERLH